MDRVHDGPSGDFARICVFCGSSSGKKAIYTEVARELGTELVRRGIDLVYGGGSIGLMGTVAQATQAAGGHVVGVIPKALMPKEICGDTVGDLVAVDDMHQRKAEMARRADAFIALPGGFGTFEEVLEIITWAQLGIHKKPVGLLNVDGYYDSILTLFDKALDEGFLNVASHNIVVSSPTAGQLLDKLKNYTPTEDKSVPELTWDSTVGDSVSNSVRDSTDWTDMKASAAILNSNRDLNGHSKSDRRSSGARASNTAVTQRIGMNRMATTISVGCSSNRGTGSCNLVLPGQVFQLARASSFSVNIHTSSFRRSINSRSYGRNIVAMRASVDDRSAGASVVARVVIMPLIM